MKTLIKNATLVNRGSQTKAHVLIEDTMIHSLITDLSHIADADHYIEAEGLLLLPGVIDDQVHFREPGLAQKGDMFTESRAAAAGGVTSFMDMPNTQPQTTTIEALLAKHQIAARNSLVNYSFYLGATTNNIAEIEKADPGLVCGIKMFMGSSTGNMLVSKTEDVSAVFAHAPVPVAVHCEDDSIISRNLDKYKTLYGNNIPMRYHTDIRSEEACYASSARAAELAAKHNAHLHILHLSTAKEIGLMQQVPLAEKTITGEVCVHHLWFSSNDYEKLNWRIKWNPSIKHEKHREALREGLITGLIDIVATDHAPHTFDEKQHDYTSCPSGAPLVQHSLPAMLEMVRQGVFGYEQVVDYMCHKPAQLFRIDRRGYIEAGYYADLVLVNPSSSFTVNADNLLYKCQWSPLEGTRFSHRVEKTWVNGSLVWDGKNIINTSSAMSLKFNR